ncbi:MAG: pyridoxamine 5'-phosphate oxidase family protein [Solirubrobacterales bacterium]
MTALLPRDVRDVFARFITTEFATLDTRGRPIVWPLTPYYTDGAPAIEVSTGVGYPKKAEDARRNPHVAMLFSDPTGSGLETAKRVLVQGTAEIDDADLAANRERYRRESARKLPATREMMPPRILEGLFGWYFERIYIRVRPERVFVWEGGDFAAEPVLLDSHMEEVRSGHSEEPDEPHPAPSPEPVAWDRRIEELGSRHPSAVLAWEAPDGFPLAVRVSPAPDRSKGRIGVGRDPAGLPLAEGPACLVAHSHGPDFRWQENFQVRGDLVREGGDWALIPHRLVGGFELPRESRLAGMRRNFSKSIRFYRTRKRVLRERQARAAAG